MANILSKIKSKLVAFAKAPDTLLERVVRVVSVLGQGSAAVLSWGAGFLPTAIVNILTAIHTGADKVGSYKPNEKLLRYLSIGSQIISAIIAWPIAWPVGVINALTAIHTTIDNLKDLLDDFKLNKSYKSK